MTRARLANFGLAFQGAWLALCFAGYQRIGLIPLVIAVGIAFRLLWRFKREVME